MWRDWFVFTKQDYRAVIILIFVVLLFVWGISYYSQKQQEVCYSTVADSMIVRDSIQRVAKRPHFIVQELFPIHMHRFDPNSADSLELRTLGLSRFVTSNIIKYRNAGGIFEEAADLSRIYGLEDSVYHRISSYISIVSREQSVEKAKECNGVIDAIELEELPRKSEVREKYKPGTFVDLNHADTAELAKIPGIGPVYAAMIVQYRESLGGFYAISQLRGLKSLPEGLGDWLFLNEEKCRPVFVNRLSVTELRKHPYISFYQARAIAQLRKREGNLSSIKQLRFLREFTNADLERLAPYLSFE